MPYYRVVLDYSMHPSNGLMQIGENTWAMGPGGTAIVGRGSDANLRVVGDMISRRHLGIAWAGMAGYCKTLKVPTGSE